MDNLVVPRLWRAHSPQICGEPQVGGAYSNTGVATETHGSRSKGSRTCSGRPSEALLRPVETVRRSVETFQELPGGARETFAGVPKRRRAPRGLRESPSGAPVRRRTENVTDAVPALRQPFLMRLVSSVTWL